MKNKFKKYYLTLNNYYVIVHVWGVGNEENNIL
jgi:hypothetical protein